MKLLMSLILFLTISPPLKAVTLRWDRNSAVDQVQKYPVYQAGVLTGPFTKIGEVLDSNCTATDCTYTLPTLSPGTYYFKVTAQNLWLESGPSNVVSTPPSGPVSPKNLIIVAVVNSDGSYTLKLVDATEFFRPI